MGVVVLVAGGKLPFLCITALHPGGCPQSAFVCDCTDSRPQGHSLSQNPAPLLGYTENTHSIPTQKQVGHTQTTI